MSEHFDRLAFVALAVLSFIFLGNLLVDALASVASVVQS